MIEYDPENSNEYLIKVSKKMIHFCHLILSNHFLKVNSTLIFHFQIWKVLTLICCFEKSNFSENNFIFFLALKLFFIFVWIFNKKTYIIFTFIHLLKPNFIKPLFISFKLKKLIQDVHWFEFEESSNYVNIY